MAEPLPLADFGDSDPPALLAKFILGLRLRSQERSPLYEQMLNRDIQTTLEEIGDA